jgi:hypothetical protein
MGYREKPKTKKEEIQMSKSVKLLGKKAIPIWLLVIVLVASGAGAAAGTVLAGKVTGEVPVAVSQAILTEAPVWTDIAVDDNQPQQIRHNIDMVTVPNRSFGAVADDNTAFQAAAEIAVGDWVAFNLPLKNASENDLVGLVTLSVPDCLEVEVYSSTNATNLNSVVRIGLNTWKVIVEAAAEYDHTEDCLMFVISADDYCAPGYYTISGDIKQIPY